MFFSFLESASNKEPHYFQWQSLYSDLLLKYKSLKTLYWTLFLLWQECLLSRNQLEVLKCIYMVVLKAPGLHPLNIWLCQVGKYSSKTIILEWLSPVWMEQISISVWCPVEKVSKQMSVWWTHAELVSHNKHLVWKCSCKTLALIALTQQDILWSS